MADVTVKQLAQVVGIPVTRLLTQLQEAGLTISDESQTLNEEQKLTLLNHLKNGQNLASRQPERITLRRKSVSQATGHDAHGGKVVNIEVRKKRVYVKRSTDEGTEEAVAPEVLAEQELVTALDLAAVPTEMEPT